MGGQRGEGECELEMKRYFRRGVVSQGRGLKHLEQRPNEAWESDKKKHSKHNRRTARIRSVGGAVQASARVSHTPDSCDIGQFEGLQDSG